MATGYSWTQPMCVHCWVDRNGDRPVNRLAEPYREPETCCYCGETTTAGIYVRLDPASVPYPATK